GVRPEVVPRHGDVRQAAPVPGGGEVGVRQRQGGGEGGEVHRGAGRQGAATQGGEGEVSGTSHFFSMIISPYKMPGCWVSSKVNRSCLITPRGWNSFRGALAVGPVYGALGSPRKKHAVTYTVWSMPTTRKRNSPERT